ncbi:MAG: hypothetical protein ACW98D_21920 [Promethearchaeota archaeon]|jgi:hypothetical protein
MKKIIDQILDDYNSKLRDARTEGYRDAIISLISHSYHDITYEFSKEKKNLVISFQGEPARTIEVTYDRENLLVHLAEGAVIDALKFYLYCSQNHGEEFNKHMKFIWDNFRKNVV